MSKHFYFGSSVFFILFVQVVAAMGANVKTIFVVGLSFLIAMCGIILNELYEQRKRETTFQNQMRERMEEISFELQIMRDCRFDQMQERTRELTKTLETLEILTNKEDHRKAEQPEATDGCKV